MPDSLASSYSLSFGLCLQSLPEERFFIPPRSAASLMDSGSGGSAGSPTQGPGTGPAPARSETEAEDVAPNPPEVRAWAEIRGHRSFVEFSGHGSAHMVFLPKARKCDCLH